jgi:hypothetical protein
VSPLVIRSPVDRRLDANLDAIGLGRQRHSLPDEDAAHLGLDAVEVRQGGQGVVLDRGGDVQGDLGRRVEAAVGDLVEDRAVPLVADAGEDRDGRAAQQHCQLQVVEPGQVRSPSRRPG